MEAYEGEAEEAELARIEAEEAALEEEEAALAAEEAALAAAEAAEAAAEAQRKARAARERLHKQTRTGTNLPTPARLPRPGPCTMPMPPQSVPILAPAPSADDWELGLVDDMSSMHFPTPPTWPIPPAETATEADNDVEAELARELAALDAEEAELERLEALDAAEEQAALHSTSPLPPSHTAQQIVIGLPVLTSAGTHEPSRPSSSATAQLERKTSMRERVRGWAPWRAWWRGTARSQLERTTGQEGGRRQETMVQNV